MNQKEWWKRVKGVEGFNQLNTNGCVEVLGKNITILDQKEVIGFVVNRYQEIIRITIADKKTYVVMNNKLVEEKNSKND